MLKRVDRLLKTYIPCNLEYRPVREDYPNLVSFLKGLLAHEKKQRAIRDVFLHDCPFNCPGVFSLSPQDSFGVCDAEEDKRVCYWPSSQCRDCPHYQRGRESVPQFAKLPLLETIFQRLLRRHWA